MDRTKALSDPPPPPLPPLPRPGLVHVHLWHCEKPVGSSGVKGQAGSSRVTLHGVLIEWLLLKEACQPCTALRMNHDVMKVLKQTFWNGTGGAWGSHLWGARGARGAWGVRGARGNPYGGFGPF